MCKNLIVQLLKETQLLQVLQDVATTQSNPHIVRVITNIYYNVV